MKRLKHYIALVATLAAGLLAASCADDELIGQADSPNGVDMSRMVEVTLPFSTSQGISTTVSTRASDTDKDSQLSGIMVFVYENKGKASENKRVAWYLFSNPASGGDDLANSNGGWIADGDNPHCGNIKFHLPVGECFIYLIGNAQGSFLDFFSRVEQNGDSQGGATQTDLTEDPLATQEGFWLNAAPMWTGNLFSTDGYLPLSGMVNNDRGACRVGSDGIIYYKKTDDGEDIALTTKHADANEDNSFLLKRLMSKVTVNIENGPGVTFTPKDYRFRHVAQYVSPTETAWTDEQRAGIPVIDTNARTFNSQSTHSFTVYLPESIWEAKSTLSSFADREAIVKDEATGENLMEETNKEGHDDHYRFLNAPQNATYLEITGHYEGPGGGESSNKTVSADTRYFIHLGDFGDEKGFNDFSLKRDHHYTYHITVKGLNSIYAEVEGDEHKNHPEAPGAESIVFEGGARVRLDAHYEQVEMQFTSGNLGAGVYIYADTPYGSVTCKYNPSAADGAKYTATDGSTLSQDDFIKHIQWIEFAQQDDKGRLARYPGRGGTMNIFQVLDDAYKVTNRPTYYTCFVNEYYYEKDPITNDPTQLSKFINASDRTFSLGSELTYSPDGKSAIAHAVYVLQQRSIACFYDLTDTKRNKYGVETVDEMAKASSSGTIPTVGNPYGNYDMIDAHGGSAEAAVKPDQKISAGRSNTMRDLISSGHYDRNKLYDAVNWEQNGFLLNPEGTALISSEKRMHSDYAYLACLARNRDLDGDGELDYFEDGDTDSGDELRWYTPSLNQVLGLWIGNPSLPAEATLFPYQKTAVLSGQNAGTCMYPIFTSSRDQENIGSRVIWAELGCASTGNSRGGETDAGYIRAVRNLGATDASSASSTTPPDDFFYYDQTNRVITLYLADNARRTGFVYNELEPHNEDDVQNRPYRTFQVARHPFVEKEITVTCGQKYGWQNWYTCDEKATYKPLITTSATDANKLSPTKAQDYKAIDEKDTDYEQHGNWRLPNQRELALMVTAMGIELDYEPDNTYRTIGYSFSHSGLLDRDHKTTELINPYLHCRTTFSVSDYSKGDYGFMFDTNNNGIRLFSSANDDAGTAGYFCVRDVIVPE